MVIYIGAEPVMGLFAPSADNIMIPLGVSYLHIMSFMYVLPGITNGLQGYVRGWGADESVSGQHLPPDWKQSGVCGILNPAVWNDGNCILLSDGLVCDAGL